MCDLDVQPIFFCCFLEIFCCDEQFGGHYIIRNHDFSKGST
jgi:hypothetical protein